MIFAHKFLCETFNSLLSVSIFFFSFSGDFSLRTTLFLFLGLPPCTCDATILQLQQSAKPSFSILFHTRSVYRTALFFIVTGNIISNSAFIPPCMNQSFIAEETQFVRVRVFFGMSNVKIKDTHTHTHTHPHTKKKKVTDKVTAPFTFSILCLFTSSFTTLLHSRSLFFSCVFHMYDSARTAESQFPL